MSDEKNTSETNSDTATTKVVSASASSVGSNEAKSDTSKKVAAESAAASETADKSKTAAKKTTRHKKRHVPWVLIFALILIAGLGGGNYWQYQQGQQLIEQVAQLGEQQSSLSNQLTNLDKDVVQTRDQQQTLSAKTEQNEAGQETLRSTLDQMSDQIKSLATTKGKAPLYWRVSEVEYLLTVANHRLMLERDVQTAKTALQDADNRLRVIADPGLIPVREKISQEINQLKIVALPDIPGMAAQLNGLIEGVSTLPFVQKNLELESKSTAETEKEFKGVGNFIKTVWHDLVDGLFKVQRSDQPVEPLLPPEEKLYLVYNLELKLEQARIALLNQETALFRTNLEDVEQRVRNYFNQESAPVTNLLQTVAQLKQVELRPPLPDISASLREIRSWMESQQQKNVASRDHALQSTTRVVFNKAEAINP